VPHSHPHPPVEPCTTIGILAHVDAGKTSLTERLLFHTGVIDHLGAVDAGDTYTDTGDIERRRGITIRTGVAAFHLGDLRVMLVDTPGHAEFVAEVERALAVLDAAVLVISAVEGIQSHTRLLMRTLTSMHVPTALFVNKLDRRGARTDELVDDIRARLAPGVVAVNTALAPGTPDAATASRMGTVAFRDDAVQVLALHDDDLLRRVVDEQRLPGTGRVQQLLRQAIHDGVSQPLVFGSARTGVGVEDLLTVVREFAPRANRSADEPLRGRVFAFDCTPGPGRPARPLVRLDSGRLQVRDRVTVWHPRRDGDPERTRARVTRIEVIGSTSGTAQSGDIVSLTGLGPVRVGDQLAPDTDQPTPDDNAAASHADDTPPRLPRPDLQTIVTAADPDDTTDLFHALADLAAHDPLIDARFVGDGRARVLLFGEVQQQVLAATLAEEYGIAAEFAPAELRHLERPVGRGRAVRSGYPLGMAAVVGLAVEPAAAGTGLDYRIEVEYGTLPGSFHEAIRQTVGHALQQGLRGWPVTDIRVRLVESGYDSIASTAGDFRQLTPLPLFAALGQAGTVVYEPLHRFDLEIPPDTIGPVLAALTRHEAAIADSSPTRGSWHITGEIPLRRIPSLRHALPGLTRGEAAWTAIPGGDRLLSGAPPVSPRTDGDPLDQQAYLRYLRGR